jgi:diguanylate cyclase (GGDEF)-like protein
MPGVGRGTLVVVGDPVVPWPVVRALVDLTERALDVGIDRAVADLAGRIRRTVGAEVGIALPPDGGRAEVTGVDPDVGRAIGDAIASAQRAAAARATETAHVDELRELARLDDLTGALNRRAFFERLDDELRRADRTAAPVTLVLCDLDGFKAINDAYGHPAGDAALRAFAELLEANVRSSDSVGRIGGDEFALILVGPDAADASAIVERLGATLRAGVPDVGGVQASFGAARAPDDGSTRDALVGAADRRLYAAKRAL